MTRDSIYDGKVLFEWWCKAGKAATNPKLMEYAKEKFGTTSQMGPAYAMWKWAFWHPQESYKLWTNWYFENHPELPTPPYEDYLLILKERGGNKQIVRPHQFRRWCAMNGLEIDYRINRDDVVQVARKSHPLFQSVFVVIRTHQEDVLCVAPSTTNSHIHQEYIFFRARELAVLGKVIFTEKLNLFSMWGDDIFKIHEVAREKSVKLQGVELSETGVAFTYVKDGETSQRAYPDRNLGFRNEEIILLGIDDPVFA